MRCEHHSNLSRGNTKRRNLICNKIKTNKASGSLSIRSADLVVKTLELQTQPHIRTPLIHFGSGDFVVPLAFTPRVRFIPQHMLNASIYYICLGLYRVHRLTVDNNRSSVSQGHGYLQKEYDEIAKLNVKDAKKCST